MLVAPVLSVEGKLSPPACFYPQRLGPAQLAWPVLTSPSITPGHGAWVLWSRSPISQVQPQTYIGSEIIEKYSIAETSNFVELTVWGFSILSGSKAAHPLTHLNGSVWGCQNSQIRYFEFSLFAPNKTIDRKHCGSLPACA